MELVEPDRGAATEAKLKDADSSQRGVSAPVGLLRHDGEVSKLAGYQLTAGGSRGQTEVTDRDGDVDM